MSKQLRVGVIGTGRIAELAHLPGFVQAGAQLVALSGIETLNLERLANQFGISRRYTDWLTMLDEGDLDAVSICTPPVYHPEMTVASVQHGYHTLVEKPMALTLEECDRMVDAAQKANVLLMVSHNQRFSARHVIAKDILRSGRLGKPYLAHAVFAHGGPENWSPNQKWYFTPSAKQGVTADLGCHKIDLLRWLLDQEVVEITAFETTNEKPTHLDDTGAMMLRFSEGTLATIQVSWTYRPDVADSVLISCARGQLHIPSDGSLPVRVIEDNPSGKPIETEYPFSPTDVPGWFGAIAAFVDAVMNSKQSPVSGEEGRATIAAVLAAHESAVRQTVVRLQP